VEKYLKFSIFETKQKVRIGCLIIATMRTKRRQSCKSLIEDAKANVEVQKTKFAAGPDVHNRTLGSQMHHSTFTV
jgi:hypothetical protein